MMTRLTYFIAAVVIAALETIPPVLAEENHISNHVRIKENGFRVVEIDLGDKSLPCITCHVIAEKTGKDFGRTVESGELQGRNPEGDQKMVACPKPRPQVCTQDYRPVCAMMHDGGFKTYSNGCNACADPAVTGYREGACEQTDDT